MFRQFGKSRDSCDSQEIRSRDLDFTILPIFYELTMCTSTSNFGYTSEVNEHPNMTANTSLRVRTSTRNPRLLAKQNRQRWHPYHASRRYRVATRARLDTEIHGDRSYDYTRRLQLLCLHPTEDAIPERSQTDCLKWTAQDSMLVEAMPV